MRELVLVAKGRLEWRERPAPRIETPEDAIVRPIVVSRCDGDTLPIHRRVSRPMQAGLKVGKIDPVVGHICGPLPFAGPFAIGHECVAEIVEVGAAVTGFTVGDRVVVPWAVSCGTCEHCQRGLTATCLTTRGDRVLSAYGFGPASGAYGGMVSDLVHVPYAGHMLVSLPSGLDPLRVAAASDNLADAWRTVVPHLRARPGARVLVIGGGAQSIGLYAAGLAVAHGAAVVGYEDQSARRRQIAQSFGASVRQRTRRATSQRATYDIVVEASSSTAGIRSAIRSTSPGGTCTAVGYYVAMNTGIALMHMYANDITLRLFPAERVTTKVAGFEEAPMAYAARTTKLVLQR